MATINRCFPVPQSRLPENLPEGGEGRKREIDSEALLMPSKMQPQRQNDVHLHFHSPDAKGVRRLLMDNAQHVRAALNSSYATYSGGSDAGY